MSNQISEIFKLSEKLDSITSGNWFVEQYGSSVRWLTDSQLWMVWDGCKKWEENVEDIAEKNKEIVEGIYELANKAYFLAGQLEAGLMLVPAGWPMDAVETVRALKRKAGEFKKFAGTCANTGFDRTVKRASSEPKVRAVQGDFDAHRSLLNTPDGIAILKENRCIKHDRNYYLTKMTRGSMGAEGAWRGGAWEEFLNYVQPVEEDRLAIQRCLGYSVLGNAVEKASFFPYGDPDTGKTLLVEAVSYAMGDYSTYMAVDAFKSGSFSSDKYSLAGLPGTRLLITSEFDQDMKINQNLLKSITGGEKITVRQIRGVPFDVKPQCTLWVPTNNLPYLGSDAGSWVRMVAVPFEHSLMGHRFSWEGEGTRNGDIALKFRGEDICNQILGWVAEGARSYSEMGLAIPEAWTALSEAEKDIQSPPVERWVIENLIEAQTMKPFSELYEVYTMERKECGQKAVPEIAFGRALKKAGYLSTRTQKNGKQVRAWNAKVNLSALTGQFGDFKGQF